jgi:hypothetical protein
MARIHAHFAGRGCCGRVAHLLMSLACVIGKPAAGGSIECGDQERRCGHWLECNPLHGEPHIERVATGRRPEEGSQQSRAAKAGTPGPLKSPLGVLDNGRVVGIREIRSVTAELPVTRE